MKIIQNHLLLSSITLNEESNASILSKVLGITGWLLVIVVIIINTSTFVEVKYMNNPRQGIMCFVEALSLGHLFIS